MKAVILAAGRGTRMMPLTKDKPKPLIPINEKPFLGYVIDLLLHAGITDIGIVVHYLKDQIVSYATNHYGSKATFTFIDQEQLRGTGHAISCVQQFVQEEPFICISGDNYYSLRDVQSIIHQTGNCVCCIEHEHPEKYGVIIIEGTKVISIDEKPLTPKSKLVNAGLYHFDKDIFLALQELKPSKNGEYYLTDALNLLSKRDTVYAYHLRDYWLDLGTPHDISIVEEFFKKHDIS